MLSLWQGLLLNATILIGVIQIWISCRALVPRFSRLINQTIFGLLFGGGTVLLMMFPYHLADGAFVDLRIALIGLGSLFGGPMVGFVSVLLAGGYRVMTGGEGMLAGLYVIWVAYMAGLTAHQVMKRWTLHPFLGLLGAALLLAVTAICGIETLTYRSLVVMWSELSVALPLITGISTFIGGVAMLQELNLRRLQRSDRMYKRVIESLPDCLNIKDVDGRFQIANPATAKLMGAASPAALICKTDRDFYPADVAERFRGEEAEILRGGEPRAFEQTYRLKDGSTGWLSTMKVPLFDRSGRVSGLVTHNRDITAQKELELELDSTRQRLAAALANMADALVMIDAEERLVFCNQQYLDMFPETAHVRVPGARLRDILRASLEAGEKGAVPAHLHEARVEEAADRLTEGGTLQFQLADGRWFAARSKPADDGSCLILCTDITQLKRNERQFMEMNERLQDLASRDGLTDIHNRRAFEAELRRNFAEMESGRSALGLLLVDIDHFKLYNDSYGHPAGDLVIKSVATCLREAAEMRGAFVARYGGEEFALVLPGADFEALEQVAHDFRRRVAALAIPHLGSRHGAVSVSIGGVHVDPVRHRLTREDMLREADQALYAAKARGRNAVTLREPEEARHSAAL